MSSDFEIDVGEVTDMEARVYVRFHGATSDERAVLRGKLSGPFCAKGRTLPAEFSLRNVTTASVATAEVIVADPCMWSEEMPHLYHIYVEALKGEQVIAEHHGAVGLRRLSPRLPVDFAPGTG